MGNSSVQGPDSSPRPISSSTPPVSGPSAKSAPAAPGIRPEFVGTPHAEDVSAIHKAVTIQDTGKQLTEAARNMENYYQDLFEATYDSYAKTLKFLDKVLPSNLSADPAVAALINLPTIKYGLDYFIVKTLEYGTDIATYMYQWEILKAAEKTYGELAEKLSGASDTVKAAMEKWGLDLKTQRAELEKNWKKAKKVAGLFIIGAQVPILVCLASKFDLLGFYNNHSDAIGKFAGLGGQIYTVYTRVQKLQREVRNLKAYNVELKSFPERMKVAKVAVALDFMIEKAEWETIDQKLKNAGVKAYGNNKEELRTKLNSDPVFTKEVVDKLMSVESERSSRAESILNTLIETSENMGELRRKLGTYSIVVPEEIGTLEEFKENLINKEYKDTIIGGIRDSIRLYSVEAELNEMIDEANGDSKELARLLLSNYGIEETGDPEKLMQELNKPTKDSDIKTDLLHVMLFKGKIGSKKIEDVRGSEIATALLNKRKSDQDERVKILMTPANADKLKAFKTEYVGRRQAKYEKDINRLNALIKEVNGKVEGLSQLKANQSFWDWGSSISVTEQQIKNLKAEYFALKTQLYEAGILKNDTESRTELEGRIGESGKFEIVGFNTWFKEPTDLEVARLYSDHQNTIQKYAKDLSQHKQMKIEREGLFLRAKLFVSSYKFAAAVISLGIAIVGLLSFYALIPVAAVATVTTIAVAFSYFAVGSTFLLFMMGRVLNYFKHPVTSVHIRGNIALKWNEYQLAKKKFQQAKEAQHVQSLAIQDNSKKEKLAAEIKELESKVDFLEDREFQDFEKLVGLSIARKEDVERLKKDRKYLTEFTTLSAATEAFTKLDLSLLDDETKTFLQDELGINVGDVSKLATPEEMKKDFVRFFGGELIGFVNKRNEEIKKQAAGTPSPPEEATSEAGEMFGQVMDLAATVGPQDPAAVEQVED